MIISPPSDTHVYKKTKRAKFFVKQTFNFPLIRTCAYKGELNVDFMENFVGFAFL